MKKFSYWFLLAGTLIMIFVMWKTGAPLTTADTPQGILNLELAWNSTMANKVLTAWLPANGIDALSAARLNTWLDFIFLFFYAFFLSTSCALLAGKLKGAYGRAGLLIGQGALLAGFFDILENAGMLITLKGNVYSNVALLTAFFSMAKWLLVILSILYLLIGLAKLAFRKRAG